MTGREIMEALSAMSSSELDREATVLLRDSVVRIGKVDVVEDEDGGLWPVVQTVGEPEKVEN